MIRTITAPLSRVFALRRSELNGWRLAAGCGFGSLLLLVLGLVEMKREDRVWVLTGSGGLYAGPLERLDRSRAFFHETALVASLAALQWSSSGFDLPELLKLYFSPQAAAVLGERVETAQPDLRARALATKPLVQFISDPVPDGPARIVEVRGLLTANGQFSGRLIYEERPFKLTFRMVRNPDVGISGMYPWIVAEVVVELGGVQ